MTFEEFTESVQASLFRLAFVLTHDREAAEDLTQTTLANLYKNWSRASQADDPMAYARRSMVNAHLSWRRRRWTREYPVDVVPEPTTASPDIASGVVARAALREGLSGLSPRARTVLVLRYYLDLDDGQIAGDMGISQNTVRSTASRALASLRQTMAEQFEGVR